MLKICLIAILGLCVYHSASASPIGDSQSGLFDPKRSGKNGFHEGIFDEGFGGFSTLKKRGKRSEEWKAKMIHKRRPEMTSRGIHGDAFTGGFGDFYTMKRSQDNLSEAYLAQILKFLEDDQLRAHDYY